MSTLHIVLCVLVNLAVSLFGCLVDLYYYFELQVFQRFGANSPERQSMLAQLAPILSMEEQQLLRGELHSSAGGYNLDHLPHSLHGKASLAWNEISKIFAANSSNSHRRLTKRSSSASQDSGCVPSDTDLDT
eukprot:scpid99319/ scgid3941/ 